MKSDLLVNQKSKIFSIGNYYPALDGLRGLAILMIILYHNFDYISITKPAWISLDLFFVLSGFLITSILLKKRNSPHFLRNFYSRRILRIIPIYYLSIAIFLFLLPHLISYPFNVHYFIINQYWFWLEIQNWLFILRPDENNNFLNHFWSLGLEEQFYLLSPWIILWIKPVQQIACFLLLMLLLLLVLRAVMWELQIKNISYVDLYAFTRIDGLCVGSLLAIFRYKGNFEMKVFNKILISLFAILIFIIFPFLKLLFRVRLPYLACCIYPSIALFWGWIVWTSINQGNLINKIFKNRVLIFFGKISYGLYILHWPINRLFKLSPVFRPLQRIPVGANVIISMISTVTAVLLAIVSYYTFERYFLGLKKYFA